MSGLKGVNAGLHCLKHQTDNTHSRDPQCWAVLSLDLTALRRANSNRNHCRMVVEWMVVEWMVVMVRTYMVRVKEE